MRLLSLSNNAAHEHFLFLLIFFTGRVVAKDTDHYNLRKPVDGQPLGALCPPVTPRTHLKGAETNSSGLSSFGAQFKEFHHGLVSTYWRVFLVQFFLLGEQVQTLLQCDLPPRTPFGDGQRQVAKHIECVGVVRANRTVKRAAQLAREQVCQRREEIK